MEGHGRKIRGLKIICADNRGEFTSGEFETYLKEEGVRHEQRPLNKTG